ncbi:hypothetical protein [Pelagibius sp.]|uniref:hypothetical protein n=1 Tax=Pelagibius sp. TaxID=1931238 RepID=UPI003BB1CDD8
MPEHKRILRKIVVLSAGMLAGYGLIAGDLLIRFEDPGGFFYSGLAVLTVSGFLAASWVFWGVEALTSTALSEFPPLWLLLCCLVIILLIALLPVAVIILLVRYRRVRHRFHEEQADDPAT